MSTPTRRCWRPTRSAPCWAASLLEARGGLLRTVPASAPKLALGWAAALAGFALVRSYPLAIALLFTAGFFELSFNSMAQTIV